MPSTSLLRSFLQYWVNISMIQVSTAGSFALLDHTCIGTGLHAHEVDGSEEKQVF
jgi:hypothetical protein